MFNPLVKEYRGRFGHGRTMADILAWVEDLPPMPDVIRRALQLVDDIKTIPEELARVIMLDPALASPILRCANSVSLGQQREIATLEEAVLVVGMGQIKTMLIASALRRWNGSFGPVQRLVWEKSLGAACGARVLCEQLNKRYRDELNLTGLLHNLGQIVLLSHKDFGKVYPDVLKRIRECDEDFVTAEREIIGFSHPLIGALVARKWDFPYSTCRAILHYAEPCKSIADEEDEKLAVLKLAAEIGLTLGFGRPPTYSLDPEELETLAGLVGLDPAQDDLKAVMSEIKTRFTSEVSAYS